MYFGYWWHSGMKRPGPTLHVIVHETGSTTDMQLVLHKWLAGVYLSYYSQYLIYKRVANNLVILVVVHVRRLDRFYLRKP